MSTIQPPPSSPLPPASPSALPPATLSVAKPPPALSQLPLGTNLEATLITSSGRTVAQFKTPFGSITTNLPPNLKPVLNPGQSLLLQIAPKSAGSGAPLLLQVLEITGRPVQTGPASAIQSGAGTPVGTPGTVSAPIQAPATLNLSVGTSLGAVLLTPVSLTGAQTAPSPKSASVPITAQTTGPQSAPSIPGAPQTAPGTVTPVRPGVSPGISSVPAHGAAPSGGASVLPTGSAMRITLVSLNPPHTAGELTPVSTPNTQSTVPSTPSLSAGQTLSGTVSGLTPSGNPILSVPLNHGASTGNGTMSISLAGSKPLPIGTQASFRIESAPQPPEPTRPMPTALHREGMLSTRQWPSMDEALSALNVADPAAGHHVTNYAIPKPDIQFTATALFFLNALRGGDVRSWLGENASRILERLKPDAMRRLGDDFRMLSGVDDDVGTPARSNEWRGTLLPFHAEGALEQIRLYTRHLNDEEDDAEPGARKGTRFLIDVTLSNIGRLQLDGMIEKADKRLNMIVRTGSNLPPVVRNDLMELFARANDIVGMQGGLTFQAAPDGFIDPAEQQPESDSGLGIMV